MMGPVRNAIRVGISRLPAEQKFRFFVARDSFLVECAFVVALESPVTSIGWSRDKPHHFDPRDVINHEVSWDYEVPVDLTHCVI